MTQDNENDLAIYIKCFQNQIYAEIMKEKFHIQSVEKFVKGISKFGIFFVALARISWFNLDLLIQKFLTNLL